MFETVGMTCGFFDVAKSNSKQWWPTCWKDLSPAQSYKTVSFVTYTSD
jgi:hypothetical protein